MKPNHENILSIAKIEDGNCGGLIIVIDINSGDSVTEEQVHKLVREYMPKSCGNILFRGVNMFGDITQNWDYFIKHKNKEEEQRSWSLLGELRKSMDSNKCDKIVYRNTSLIEDMKIREGQPMHLTTNYQPLGSL